jgi:peptidoglycan hydrolase CwlO-like protein
MIKYRHFHFLSMMMVATLVSAFSRDGPPASTQHSKLPYRALPDTWKSAATAALVVALSLPFVEPAWAVTYTNNNDVLVAIEKLETNISAELDAIGSKIDDIGSKIDDIGSKIDDLDINIGNKVDSIKYYVGYAPAITSIIGMAASGYVSVKSIKRSDQAVANAKERVNQECNK